MVRLAAWMVDNHKDFIDSRKDSHTMGGFGLEQLWPSELDLRSPHMPAFGTAVELVLHTVTFCSSLWRQPAKPHFVAVPCWLRVHIAECKPLAEPDFGSRTVPSTERCSRRPPRLCVAQERQLAVHHRLSWPLLAEGREFCFHPASSSVDSLYHNQFGRRALCRCTCLCCQH
jgi:hypothetical protein